MPHSPNFSTQPSQHPPHQRGRPAPWNEFSRKTPHPILLPFLFIDWCCQHLAFYLSRWAFLEVLEYLGSLSILFAVILYFAESGQRREQKHYQAWLVINTAEGKGGNGGRIEALQELNADNVALIGVHVDGAFLFEINLENARLRRASFNSADLRQAHLQNAGLEQTSCNTANFRDADLRHTDFTDADLNNSDLTGANLASARVTNVIFDNVDLVNCNLTDLVDWQAIRSINKANIHGIINPPAGFTKWALAHGAVDVAPQAK